MPEPQSQLDSVPSDESVEAKAPTSNHGVNSQIKPADNRLDPFDEKYERSDASESKEARFENELRHSRPSIELVHYRNRTDDLEDSEQLHHADRLEIRPLLSIQDSQSRGPNTSPKSNVDRNDQLIPSVVAQMTSPNTVQTDGTQSEKRIGQLPNLGILDSLEQELNKPPTISHEQIAGVNVAETPNVFALEQEMAKTPKPSQVEEKQINVHIGRIEIKAMKEPAAQKRAKAKRPAIGGLDDYLKLQSERSRQ